MLIQESTCLARRKRRLSKAPWLLMIPQSFASFTTYRYCFSSFCPSLTTQMWSEVDNSLSTMTALIRSQLAHSKLVYFPSADVTRLLRYSLDLFTSNVLSSLTTRRRVFKLPKKRQGKKVYCRTFPNPSNSCPISFVMHCKNIHSDWISRATVAYLSWGYFSIVLVTARIFLSHFSVWLLSQLPLDFSSLI